jgi:hypothetical protein
VELSAECKCLVESVRPAINEIVLSNSSEAVVGNAGYCTRNIVYYILLAWWKGIYLQNLYVDSQRVQIIFVLASKEGTVRCQTDIGSVSCLLVLRAC